jgi:Zn-dependent peptidase ImmA (M78 family)/DNA-binding XRE family transcriptional regulator
MIGQRLRLARARAGLSLRDLSGRIDNLVSAQAIGKYERDEMVPGSRVLIALAEALDVSESYLVGQGEVELEDVEFRSDKTTSARDSARVKAAVIDHLERYLVIEEILQAASQDWDRPRGSPFPVVEVAGAELAAKNVRDYWGLGLNPIPNLVEFLEEKGIKVLALDLPEAFSGLTCWVRRKRDGRVPVIVINSNHSGERERFTICHELGHMLLEVGEGLDAEKVAHRFAGSFLMPAEVVWAEIGKHRNSMSLGELFALKRLVGLSVQAVAYRCKDLGIIGPSFFRRLFQHFSEQGWRTPPYPEPFAIQREKPQRFKRLCFRALAEGAISDAKAAELLGISVRQLNQEMEAPQTIGDGK